MSQSALTDNILQSRKSKLRKVIRNPVTTLEAFCHGIGSLRASSKAFRGTTVTDTEVFAKL